MSDNKPKIYGFCKAGCQWETVHKDDFDRSATWIKQYPASSGVYELTPVKNYKIVSPVSANAYSCAVSLSYKDGTVAKTHSFIISEYDEYRAYFYFEILRISVLAGAMRIVYEVNGNRYSEIVEGTSIDISDAVLKITGATAVYIFNDDASITTQTVLDGLCNQVINQDLTAADFNPVANTYYCHIGSTNNTFANGIIYYYDGETFKAVIGKYVIVVGASITEQ